jgi:hypothetical protein
MKSLVTQQKAKEPVQKQESPVVEDQTPVRKPPAFGLQASQLKENEAAPLQKQDAAAAPPAAEEKAARPKISGDFAYGDDEFKAALKYISQLWGLTSEAPVEVESKDAKKVGDSPGQDPDGTPAWVKQVTTRLVNTQPDAPGLDGYTKYKGSAASGQDVWNEDSTLAQRLVAAYYKDWYLKQAAGDKSDSHMPGHVPSNVEEMMDRVGSSKTNKRAQLIGETPGAYYGWCGPGSQFPIALGLLRKGYRFKTGSGPTMPKNRKPQQIPQLPKKDPEPYKGYNKRAEELAQMQEKANADAVRMNKFEIANAMRLEVAKQGAYFLSTWAKGKQKNDPTDQKEKGAARVVGGKAAHTAKLETGDHISIVLGGSPVSGHVATVIKEEPVASTKEGGHEPGDVISKIYYISGNSKGSAVRVEVVERELPPSSYDWGAVAGKGNKFTDLKQAETVAMNKANKAVGGGNIQAALMQKLLSKPDLRKQATALAKGAGFTQYIPANWARKDIILPFFQLAGMNPDKYIESLTNPHMAEAEEAREKKDAYKAEMAKEGIPVDHNDPNFSKLNTDKRTDGKSIGKIKPVEKSHGWVVSIVKSSLLDAHAIDGEVSAAIAGSEDKGLDAETKITDQVLAKYGLEKVPADWMAYFNEGLNYWEPEGGHSNK